MRYVGKKTYKEIPIVCLLSKRSLYYLNKLFNTNYKGVVIEKEEEDYEKLMQPTDYRNR